MHWAVSVGRFLLLWGKGAYTKAYMFGIGSDILILQSPIGVSLDNPATVDGARAELTSPLKAFVSPRNLGHKLNPSFTH